MMRNEHQGSLFQLEASPLPIGWASACMVFEAWRSDRKNLGAYRPDTMMGRKSAIRWSLLSSDTSNCD